MKKLVNESLLNEEQVKSISDKRFIDKLVDEINEKTDLYISFNLGDTLVIKGTGDDEHVRFEYIY